MASSPIEHVEAMGQAALVHKIQDAMRRTVTSRGGRGSHLLKHGFGVTVYDLANLSPIKARHGVPADLQACHTALVDGYVIEGTCRPI